MVCSALWRSSEKAGLVGLRDGVNPVSLEGGLLGSLNSSGQGLCPWGLASNSESICLSLHRGLLPACGLCPLCVCVCVVCMSVCRMCVSMVCMRGVCVCVYGVCVVCDACGHAPVCAHCPSPQVLRLQGEASIEPSGRMWKPEQGLTVKNCCALVS